jgi:carbonic anhydrase/acetyltransferase-like protein (isoleucine patch superfamily)
MPFKSRRPNLIGDSPYATILIDHAGKRPTIDPTAWVAPDATLCGDVTIGPGVRILHGARLAEVT